MTIHIKYNVSKYRFYGGFLYFMDIPKLPIKSKYPPPKLYARVISNRKIIDTVMSSGQEYETILGFINVKDALPRCNDLQ